MAAAWPAKGSGLGERRVAFLEPCGDCLHLIGTADQRADLLLLGREASRQLDPPGEVEQPLSGLDRVGAVPGNLLRHGEGRGERIRFGARGKPDAYGLDSADDAPGEG